MNNKYWEEEIETMPREQLRELQLQRLKKTVSIAANSPYYKKVFQEHGITADSIRSIEDIRKIPFTTKADMRANYPFGLVAGDMREDGVRIHSSSGTTGTPTVINGAATMKMISSTSITSTMGVTLISAIGR